MHIWCFECIWKIFSSPSLFLNMHMCLQHYNHPCEHVHHCCYCTFECLYSHSLRESFSMPVDQLCLVHNTKFPYSWVFKFQAVKDAHDLCSQHNYNGKVGGSWEYLNFTWACVFAHCKKKWVVLTHIGYLRFIPVSIWLNNFINKVLFSWCLLMIWKTK